MDFTRVVGLISLPGAMTGLILTGVDPLTAIRYQIVVMYMVLAAAALAALVAGRMTERALFDQAHRLSPVSRRPKGSRMISWGQIAYGAVLSAIGAGLVCGLATRGRQPAAIIAASLAAAVGPLAWNAILRATHGTSFFVDAPILVFPVSWQDTGSGVFALATAAVLLGAGPLRSAPARRATVLAVLAGLSALVVDVYLY